LIAAGAIQDKDFPALCRLCELYANWRFCQAVIAEKGCTYTTTSDRGAMRIVARPEASLELQYHKEMLNLERKFGLNPVDGKEIKFKKDDAKKSVRDRY
jgi:P27 family predicted phage terminase small subunit